MSLIDKQLSGETPRAGTMAHGITAGGVAKPLLVNTDGTVNVTGGGGGTEYTEGDTDASITGSVILMEGAANTIVPAQGTVADGMLVNLGANNDVTVSGVSTSAKQDTIIGHVDGIETVLGTIDTDTGGIATSAASLDTKTPALGQALAAASTPVVLTAAQMTTLTPPAAITGFATEAKQDTEIASLSVLDDWDESDRAKVNPIVGQAGIAAGTGVDGVTVPRVSLATNVALPAGTNNIGDVDVASIAAGDNNIGNVDIVTMPTVTVNAHAVTNAGTFAVQESGGALTALQIMDDWDNAASDGASISGDTAADAVDAGEPVKIGGKAVSADPTAVATNDRVNALFDLLGKQIVLPYAIPENSLIGTITTSMTGTTSTAVSGMGAPGAGLRNYITTVIMSNAHATVGTDIILQDGSGGTTIGTFPAAAVYGGCAITLPTPIRQPTTNTALYAANVTTGASTKVTCYGYKGI